mmetsp:Transcript_33021/g.65371  ORF Transcript_33021/g.65371 Transcript_33021/m.65371 type:complete len:258 (+) Transcript_33021:131-904(+)
MRRRWSVGTVPPSPPPPGGLRGPLPAPVHLCRRPPSPPPPVVVPHCQLLLLRRRIAGERGRSRRPSRLRWTVSIGSPSAGPDGGSGTDHFLQPRNEHGGDTSRGLRHGLHPRTVRVSGVRLPRLQRSARKARKHPRLSGRGGKFRLQPSAVDARPHHRHEPRKLPQNRPTQIRPRRISRQQKYVERTPQGPLCARLQQGAEFFGEELREHGHTVSASGRAHVCLASGPEGYGRSRVYGLQDLQRAVQGCQVCRGPVS